MIALWPVARRAWMAALLGMSFVCWAGAAYAVSATLFVTPSPDVKPGDNLTFRMEAAYQDPAPVVLVYLGGTMWTTELQTVKYPGPGMTGTVKFAKPYTVPSDAKNASTLCFVPATGGGNVDVKQPIGEKKCVTVKFMVQIKKDIKVAQVSKAAVNRLTTSIAQSNASRGVRCNAIALGLVDTPMAVGGIAAARDVPLEVVRAERNARVPLKGGMGSAWDTANAALFLASDEARFITGVILPVDGGTSIRIG